MGQSANTIARRVVDPKTRTITEDLSRDGGDARGAKSFHVVMTVDGDRFTMTESSGAFTGSGSLVGEPWQWTSWRSTSKITNTTIEVESQDQLTPSGLISQKTIKQAGATIGTTRDELKSFDCAHWDEARSALATPVLDRAACEHACRNFATLKYWEHADLEISVLPPSEQAAARAAKLEDFTAKLAAGLDSCIAGCLAANNAEQTACWANAKTAAQLAACEQ